MDILEYYGLERKWTGEVHEGIPEEVLARYSLMRLLGLIPKGDGGVSENKKFHIRSITFPSVDREIHVDTVEVRPGVFETSIKLVDNGTVGQVWSLLPLNKWIPIGYSVSADSKEATKLHSFFVDALDNNDPLCIQDLSTMEMIFLR